MCAQNVKLMAGRKYEYLKRQNLFCIALSCFNKKMLISSKTFCHILERKIIT